MVVAHPSAVVVGLEIPIERNSSQLEHSNPDASTNTRLAKRRAASTTVQRELIIESRDQCCRDIAAVDFESYKLIEIRATGPTPLVTSTTVEIIRTSVYSDTDSFNSSSACAFWEMI